MIFRKLNLNCTCGASWHGVMPKGDAFRIEQEFNFTHSGEGHTRCKSAAAARRINIEEKRRVNSLIRH